MMLRQTRILPQPVSVTQDVYVFLLIIIYCASSLLEARKAGSSFYPYYTPLPKLQGLRVLISIHIFSPGPQATRSACSDLYIFSAAPPPPPAPQATRIAYSDLYLHPWPPKLQGLHVQISISIFSPGPPIYKDCMFRSLSLSSPQAPQATRIACSDLNLYLLPWPPKLQGLHVQISISIFSPGPPIYKDCMFISLSLSSPQAPQSTRIACSNLYLYLLHSPPPPPPQATRVACSDLCLYLLHRPPKLRGVHVRRGQHKRQGRLGEHSGQFDLRPTVFILPPFPNGAVLERQLRNLDCKLLPWFIPFDFATGLTVCMGRLNAPAVDGEFGR